MPRTHIKDVTVTTDVKEDLTEAEVNFMVKVDGDNDNNGVLVNAELYDADGNQVGSATGLNGAITVSNPQLWWPYLMDEVAGYLYVLKVEVMDQTGIRDVYRLNVGIRSEATKVGEN